MSRYFPGGKITQIHGQAKFDDALKRAYYPLFHPAAVLRNPGLVKEMENDFRRLPEVLARVKVARAAGQPQQNGGSKPDDPPPEPPKQLSLF